MDKFLYSAVALSAIFAISLHASNSISLGEFKSYSIAKKIVKKYPNSQIIMIENSHGVPIYKVLINPENKTIKKQKNIVSKKRIFKIKETPKEEVIDINKKIKPIVKKVVKDKKVNIHDSHSGITLHEAILIALKKSNKIMAAREKVVQAKRVLDEKYGAFKPKVDFMANSNRIRVKPKDEERTVYSKNDYTLSLKQNIYAGGKNIGELKREKANLKVAESKFKQKVEEETTKIIDAYYALIYQTKSINITKKNMKLLEKILNIVKIKEQNGAATKGDLNYIKSQIENASSELIKQKSLYQNSLSMYEYFVGKDSSLLPIEEKIEYKKFDKKNLLNILNNNNSKIEVAKAKIETEKYNLSSLKSKFKPTVDFTIRDRGKFTNSDVEPSEKRTTGILTLNYNIYNGDKDKSKILGSKSKILELKYKLVDLEDSMKFNLKQIYETTISSQDSMLHTKKEVDANKKVIDSYWNAFKYGSQDIQALMLAQRALNRSELDLIKEKQKYTSNYFNLLKVSGILLDELHINDFIDSSKMTQDESINYLY